MSKPTQLNRVERLLKQQSYVSRNYYLDLPTDKITRLSSIIQKLRLSGLDILTDEKENDTVYRIKPKGVRTLTLSDGSVIKQTVY